MKEQVLSILPVSFPWSKLFHCFDCVDSTNSLAKTMAADGAPHGTVVLAGQQTAGRGRMGRSFHSPANMGVYLSVILRPMVMPTQLMHLTCATGVAVCNAIEKTMGLRPGIKWTNDLVYQKKKLGGILTELSLNPNTGMVEYAVIGIGINCNHSPHDFPEELCEIAGSLKSISGKAIEMATLIANLLISLEDMISSLLPRQKEIMAQYRNDCITLGQEISVVKGDFIRHGKALNVDDDGALTVLFHDGTIETVNTGEVSIRGMYGYL